MENYERFLVLSTASRVAENGQIRKNSKEISRSEFRSKNKIGQETFIFNSVKALSLYVLYAKNWFIWVSYTDKI